MRRLHWFLFLLLLSAITGCDHATKHLAATKLAKGASVVLIPGVLDLRYALNTDSAFSLLHPFLPEETRIRLLTVTAVIATVAIALFAVVRWRQAGTLERVAAAALLAGGLGNVLDRLVRGPVVDFIHLHYWPVFNVADLALSFGAGLLVFASVRARLRRSNNSAPG